MSFSADLIQIMFNDSDHGWTGVMTFNEGTNHGMNMFIIVGVFLVKINTLIMIQPVMSDV